MAAPADAAVRNLLQWATERGAVVHPAVELSVDTEAGRGWKLKADVAPGDTLLSVPLSLCIAAPMGSDSSGDDLLALRSPFWRSTVTTASARRVSEHLAAVTPALDQVCTHAVLLAFLLSHHERSPPPPTQAAGAAPSHASQASVPNLFGLPLPAWLFEAEEAVPPEAAAAEGAAWAGAEPEPPGCGYAPYLACLPRPGELNLLPSWPADALEELTCTSLAPQLARIQAREHGSEGAEMAAFLRSAMPAGRGGGCEEGRGEGGAAMTDAAAQVHLDHAMLLCKSRAFVLSDDSTDSGSDNPERRRRLLVPLLDLINHSVEPKDVCTAVRVERNLPCKYHVRDSLAEQKLFDDDEDQCQPETTHEEQEIMAVKLVATRHIAAGTALCLSYGEFSSADCLERFGFVSMKHHEEADGAAQTPLRAAVEHSRAVRLAPAEAASVPLDAVVAACGMTEGLRLQLDTLVEQRLARQAAAGDDRRRNGHIDTALDAPRTDVDVLRVGHPDDERGLDALLAALRAHSGESLEQSIVDRCYNAEAIRAVARDVIGWTIANHWPRTLREELRWLRNAECELALDESLSLAGVGSGALPLGGTPPAAAAAVRPNPGTVDVDAVEVRLVDAPGRRDQARSEEEEEEWEEEDEEEASRAPSWFGVQAARLRVLELSVLSRWHEALAAAVPG
jgi:hypothetical protein